MTDELMGIQRDMLYIIAGSDNQCGIDIKEELERYYGEDVRGGRLYSNLDKLVNHGLVEKNSRDYHTNEYTLTRDGWHTIAVIQKWKNDQAGKILENRKHASSDLR
jgi:PadR family transcriptional regulator PadR